MVEAMEMVGKAEKFEQRMIKRNEDEDEEEEEEDAEEEGEDEEEEEENDVSKWESDIPKMVLRVLLVEADDSTRQIVTALLRKCGYRVSAVSDGLKAWETLKERARNIHLVLTEMDLPLMSGFALLSLVMQHNVCKDIPLIMMSSQDSVSMVFKCMLKGAVDYLIKPLRRNELRNLWRHVWRRNTLFQRQVPQNLTVQQQIPEPSFGKNVPRNCSRDSLVSAPTTKDRSEQGSDAQSSCTTPYLEPESEKVTNMQDISLLKCMSASKFTKTNVEKEDSDKLDAGLIMDVSETREKSNLFKPDVVSCNRAYKSTVLRLEEDHISAKRAKLDESVHTSNFNQITSCCNEMVNQSREAVDVNGFIGKNLRCNNGLSVVNDGTNYSEDRPHLELSLRRNLSRISNSQVTDEGPRLHHSNASAFSWYNNSSTLRPLFAALPNGSTKSKEAVKNSEETSQLNQSSGNSIKASQQHEQYMAVVRSGPVPVTDLQFDKLSNGPHSQFLQSLYYVQYNLSPVWSPISESRREKSPFNMNETSNHVEDPENHQSEETSDDKSTDQTTQDPNDSELVEDLKPNSLAADQSSAGNACYGRNDDSTTSMETLEVDVKANSAPTQSLNDLNGQFVHEKFVGMDSVWISQREAALAKFRMKRKDRCFEKKVRYQRRKKLAEQRPRLKGQFVRQSAN